MPTKESPAAQRTTIPASRGGLSLLDQARDQRRQWEATVTQCGLRHTDLSREAISRQIADAGRRSVERVARAMLHEGLIRAELRREGEARVLVSQPGGHTGGLVLHGLEPDSLSLFPRLQLYRQDAGNGLSPIEDPLELFELFALGPDREPSRDLLRLAAELTNGLLNDALCNAYRAGWSARLRNSARAARQTTFWEWLKDRWGKQNCLLMLEQWSAVGHPYHPTHKTKLGMTQAEVVAFGPEFEPEVRVGLMAARRAQIRSEIMPGAPPIDRWLDHYLPAYAEAWRDTLIKQGRDPSAYIAIPVHPWQADHVIPKCFRRSIAHGDLVPLPGLNIPCTPTLSLRTLVPAGLTDAPHIKLSLGVRLTSVPRTISPRSCEMGPRISRLLQDLIETDPALSSRLNIVPEEVGLYYASPDADEYGYAEHLAALLRQNPARLCDSDELLVPTTALTAVSPMTGAPLFLELSDAAVEASAVSPRAHFRRYAEALLCPLLTLYFRYGIGLEAHQQNTLAVYTSVGVLRRFVFRDFGGVRIHEPALHNAGLDLTVHPDRLTVVDDRNAVRRKLITSTLHYHIGFLISRICHHLQVSERPFWSDVADVVRAAMDDLRSDVAAPIWRQDLAAFLDNDWEFKASLRMRLEDVSRDVYVRGTNPLRRAADLSG